MPTDVTKRLKENPSDAAACFAEWIHHREPWTTVETFIKIVPVEPSVAQRLLDGHGFGTLANRTVIDILSAFAKRWGIEAPHLLLYSPDNPTNPLYSRQEALDLTEEQARNVAHNLALRMREKGLKQADLANLAGVSTATIARYLSGKHQNPRCTDLVSVCHGVDVDPQVVAIRRLRPDATSKLLELVERCRDIGADKLEGKIHEWLSELDSSTNESK